MVAIPTLLPRFDVNITRLPVFTWINIIWSFCYLALPPVRPYISAVSATKGVHRSIDPYIENLLHERNDNISHIFQSPQSD